MAVRPMIRALSVMILLLLAIPAFGCFGPKLYLGVGEDATGRVLASFVAIYVKETTGTEVERIFLEGRDPLVEIAAEKIDFSFVDSHARGGGVLMQIGDLPPLLTGPRIDNHLQFTTVRPALAHLEAKLTKAEVMALSKKVEEGAMAMDIVRRFLLERRWI